MKMGHIKCSYYLLLILAIPYTTSGIKIGGLFDYQNADVELAFKYAIEILNNGRMPHSAKLEYESVRIPFGDEFTAGKKLCHMFEKGNGIAAIFGPKSQQSAIHVQSICDTKEMPHIETRSDVYTKQPTINLHPHPYSMQNLFIQLITSFEWKEFTILYESASWLVHISDLLKMYDNEGYTVTVRQLMDQKLKNNYRDVLDRVKHSQNRNIILECSIDILPEVLRQAQQINLLTDHHHFIITNLDFHTIDIEPFSHSGTNITGMRLVDPDDATMRQFTEYFRIQHNSRDKDVPEGLTAESMRIETALMFDAVFLFNEAIQQLNFTKRLKTVSLQCDDTQSWNYGYSIINFMKTSHIRGLTRDIKFDHMGLRSDFLLDLYEVSISGLHKLGDWNSTSGLKFSREHIPSNSSSIEGSFRNKTFTVITALSPPYGMLTDSSFKLNGNERFEGFGIDLIHELSLMLGFNYTFVLQEDGNYGSLDKATGKWGGMMNEIMEGRVDLGITDLTITSDRESAVDFTMPFMNLGIQILYKKPTKAPPFLFSFLSPFSNEVWFYLGGAYIGVSLTFFILGRLSPSEWDNPYPCIEEPDTLENQFSSFSNAMWFATGALLQQGSEIAPKGVWTRAVASIWYFFILIMVSSYTANLAAFLTVDTVDTIIDSAEALAKKNGAIKYGAKVGGSTLNFFRDADDQLYKKMYEFMNNPEYLTSSNEAGLKRVQSENYAYIMESTSIEYLTERNCDVAAVGGLLDDKGYGIAMQKNSPYRASLSEAVLRLQEQGRLTLLKTKWWKEKRGGGACSAGSGGDESATALGMDNLGGVFYVLCGGGVLATVIGLFTYFYLIIKRAKQYKVPFTKELFPELKFVVKCSEMTKTVRHRKSSSTEPRNSQDRTSGSLNSRNSCTPGRDVSTAYGFRIDGKNGKKEDLNLKAII